jgi:alkylhydroperoxidase/carboxymuconolactone decarboxylase family protein YurZ
LNLYADHQVQGAMNGALGQQDQAIAQHGADELAASEAARAKQMGLTRRKFGAIDDMLAGFTKPATDPRAQQRITDTVAGGTPIAAQTNGQQTAWSQHAAAPIDARTQNLMTLAGDAAQQDTQTQQRGDALSGFGRADQNLGVESRDFNALADVEGAARNRAWQQRLSKLQRAFTDAQHAGDNTRLWGSILGGAGQIAGAAGANSGTQPAEPDYGSRVVGMY